MTKKVMKDSPGLINIVGKPILRVALAFLIFFTCYTGIKEGLKGMSKAKTWIEKFWNEKIKEEPKFRRKSRTRKEIAKLA